ncbi:hypothetical protein LQ318_13490 [Aliifodinibius salicampi]|uniref:Repeat domain-containing protein n=1 Tax=Fodinibius salicampi TaxID=1920655 RepID=A0ABT3Q1D4_9BACT|nr:hypothetical protein [Fodinibius salicampi]MCW9713919.1 hypothetical protein [Fodinibius salicampi]
MSVICLPAGYGYSQTVVVDASDFLDRLQHDHYITDADRLDLSWVFNNTGLYIGSRSQYVIDVDIPEEGTWHLFARTHGNEESYMRIAVDNKLSDGLVGNAPMDVVHNGTFELQKGTVPVRLMQIDDGPVFDVLVLTKNKDFTEKDLSKHEFHPDVKLLKDYDIPEASSVKFGDLTGNGQTDFLLLTPDYSAIGFNNKGEQLWAWESPEEYSDRRASFEAPGLVWDLDRDGASEAIFWYYENGTEWLVAADGETGEIIHQAEWPTAPLPHAYNNFRLAVGNLDGGYPDNVIVYTDHGGQSNVSAYSSELERIWKHKEDKQKDHLGHYVYPRDFTGDGKDEVAVGSMLLSPEGEEIWNRFDLFYNNRDHVDSYRFDDLNGDGVDEMIAAHSEVGALVYDSRNGDILWQNTAEHTQQVETGNYLQGVEGPQVAFGARTYGNRSAGEHYLWAQVQWYTPDGELVKLWPEKPINGNPVFVKGDWDGDGQEDLFWHKFKMQDDGSGTLYFGDMVYHMFDFTGNGADEVITLGDGRLRIYGHRDPSTSEDRKFDPDYIKNRIANHTHY